MHTRVKESANVSHSSHTLRPLLSLYLALLLLLLSSPFPLGKLDSPNYPSPSLWFLSFSLSLHFFHLPPFICHLFQLFSDKLPNTNTIHSEMHGSPNALSHNRMDRNHKMHRIISLSAAATIFFVTSHLRGIRPLPLIQYSIVVHRFSWKTPMQYFPGNVCERNDNYKQLLPLSSYSNQLSAKITHSQLDLTEKSFCFFKWKAFLKPINNEIYKLGSAS